PVPRIFSREEWARLATGLAQRARALDALVADAYGERRAVADGLLPEAALTSSPYFEPVLAAAPPPPVSLGIVGFDVARREDGELVVLEDNVLTPGHAAVPAARDLLALWRHVGTSPREVHGPFRAAFAGMLAATGADPGRTAILGD